MLQATTVDPSVTVGELVRAHRKQRRPDQNYRKRWLQSGNRLHQCAQRAGSSSQNLTRSGHRQCNAILLSGCRAMPVHTAIAMPRSVAMRRRGQIYDLTVAYPAFGNNVVGELLHVFTGPRQDRHL